MFSSSQVGAQTRADRLFSCFLSSGSFVSLWLKLCLLQSSREASGDPRRHTYDFKIQLCIQGRAAEKKLKTDPVFLALFWRQTFRSSSRCSSPASGFVSLLFINTSTLCSLFCRPPRYIQASGLPRIRTRGLKPEASKGVWMRERV